MCDAVQVRPPIRAVVLCDHPVLREAIEVGLRHRFQVEIVQVSPGEGMEQSLPEADELDLVVLATLSPTSKPLLLLDTLSRDGGLGRVPLLMISEQPLAPPWDAETVFHLRFPFGYDDLYKETAEILSSTYVAARARARGVAQ
jgi:hypothetical protein